MNHRILIVDDNFVNREIIGAVLKQLGIHHIEKACDGEEAIKYFHSFKPTLVLLDISMPKMNGLECLKKIKILDRDKRAKIVMVTGSAEKEIVIEALKSGASGYIVKPLTQEAIKKYL